MQWQFYEIMYQKIKSRKFQTMFQTISFHLLRRKTSLEGRKCGEKWRSSVFKQHFQLKQFFGCLESFAQEERRSQKVPHYTSHYCIWAGDLLEVCESVVIIIFLNQIAIFFRPTVKRSFCMWKHWELVGRAYFPYFNE